MKKKTKPTGAAKSERSRPAKSVARRIKLSVTTKRSPNQVSDPRNLGDEAEVPQSTLPRCPIVGIGASAGGLEALTQLLEPIPANTNVAIIIVQHLAPKQESVLSSLLSIHSQLPVVDVRDGVVVEPNQVYVVPPNTQLEIGAGKLKLSPRPEDRSQYRPIDFFLRSLATFAQTQCLGVILSGSDSDGAVGLQEIKAAGGITIAQEPKSAKFDGMPRSAIATGIVDLVLPPADIAREIVRISRHPLIHHDHFTDPTDEAPAEQHLQRIFSLLRSATGVDFTDYKLPTIRRRMQRRMVLHKISAIEQYVKFLQQYPNEVRALYQDILIHVTRFFRDAETFDTLTSRVFPKIMAGRIQGNPIRMWVPGCSTGEEAYSISIALQEFLGEQAGDVQVQIFATDVSESAIEQARLGLYPQSIEADLSPERLRQYFTKTDGKYRVSKRVRDLCIFARQDLTRDPPFSKLDLIVCRNVLIYLNASLQKKLMNVFHYALKPGAFLMLGSAETTGSGADLFVVIDKRHRLYGNRASGGRGLSFPMSEHDLTRIDRSPVATTDTRTTGNIQNEANRIVLNRYAPSGVIVDDNLEIVQFRGQTGPFLEPAPGEATLNLFKMVREGLMHGLRNAIRDVRQSNKPIRREGLRVKSNGTVQDVNVEIIPLTASTEGRHYLILFEESKQPTEAAPARAKRKTPEPTQKEKEKRVARLQEELAANREYLQSIIQDLEATNEELQSANEEILSANEELQSTNEELDTAKEELQSTNEELNTVNDELQARNEEISAVNSDLINLLGSVQIAIVIVAGDLRVRRFTPMAEKVLNLIPTDIGRPISDIKPNIDCPDLEELIAEAMESVITIEREVRDRNGNWFALRIRPYTNVEKRIDGAVLALFDIDQVRRKELEASEARAYADAIIETLRQPLLVLDSDLKIHRANRAFYQTFRVSSAETQNRMLYELGNEQWDIALLRTELDKTMKNGQAFEGLRVEHDFPHIGHRTMMLNGRVLPVNEGSGSMLLLAIEDVTGRETANTAASES